MAGCEWRILQVAVPENSVGCLDSTAVSWGENRAGCSTPAALRGVGVQLSVHLWHLRLPRAASACCKDRGWWCFFVLHSSEDQAAVIQVGFPQCQEKAALGDVALARFSGQEKRSKREWKEELPAVGCTVMWENLAQGSYLQLWLSHGAIKEAFGLRLVRAMWCRGLSGNPVHSIPSKLISALIQILLQLLYVIS